MNAQISEILNRMRTRGNDRLISVQATDMAELLSLIAAEQAKAASKMERQTNKLICLSWALVGLTVGLLLYTIMLYNNTHP